MEKTCSKCKQVLPLNAFGWRDKQRGTLRSECKQCHNSYMNEHNKESRNFVNTLKEQRGCVKCSEHRFYTLDFHHVNPNEKDDTIARLMVHSSLTQLKAEIEKCIILCSNCHREFHYLNTASGITIEQYLST